MRRFSVEPSQEAGKITAPGQTAMKKTLSMLTIVLTLCLVAACSSPSKKEQGPVTWRPMTDEEVKNDPLCVRYWTAVISCMDRLPEEEAFNHASSSAFFKSVRALADTDCRTHERLWGLRVCELVVDPKTGPVPTSPCSGSRYFEEQIDRQLDEHTLTAIGLFDARRVAKGLPPRPSFDK